MIFYEHSWTNGFLAVLTNELQVLQLLKFALEKTFSSSPISSSEKATFKFCLTFVENFISFAYNLSSLLWQVVLRIFLYLVKNFNLKVVSLKQRVLCQTET